jgi:hypothetical protein
VNLKENPDLYYCNNCKKIFHSLKDLYFIEDGSPRGFCSESCIETFFDHLVKHFENIDQQLRLKLNCVEESCLDIVGEPRYMEGLIEEPDEVWVRENDLKEEIFCYIKKFNDFGGDEFYMVLTCLVFDRKPSFIISATATQNIELVNSFKLGEQQDLDAPDKASNLSIDDETLESIEGKKSRYLASMLQDRNESDIPFEDFMSYDEFLYKTLEKPDEVYCQTDDEGDTIYTYIRVHEREGTSFYYIVLCISIENDWKQKKENLLPILTFPSKDPKLYNTFKKGSLITGSQLKN